MNNLLTKYNAKKINLIFHGFDIKVEEPNKFVQLNQYANSLFTSFSINSPALEDKKGIFIFSVDDTIVYVGMTNDSLKKVMMRTYGNIIPRKLHKDGQLTACRLSAFLNENQNKNIELWFITCEDKEKCRQIKNELIDEYHPEINKKIIGAIK